MNHIATTEPVAAPRIDIHGAYVARTNLKGADLTNADLTEANAAYADFRGATMHGTCLDKTNLKGADLRDVIGLTLEQLRLAILDKNTRLPDYINPEEL